VCECRNVDFEGPYCDKGKKITIAYFYCAFFV